MPVNDELFALQLQKWMMEKYTEADNKSAAVEMLAKDLGCSIMWVWKMLNGRVPGRKVRFKLMDLGFKV